MTDTAPSALLPPPERTGRNPCAVVARAIPVLFGEEPRGRFAAERPYPPLVERGEPPGGASR